MKLDDFALGKQLGQGKFGEYKQACVAAGRIRDIPSDTTMSCVPENRLRAGSVWKAKHKATGKIVVLKVMRKQELIVRKLDAVRLPLLTIVLRSG